MIPSSLSLPGTSADGLAGRFRAATPWSAVSAVLATAAIVVFAIGVAAALDSAMIAGIEWLWPGGADGRQRYRTSLVYAMAVMVIWQAMIIALVLQLAGWSGGHRQQLLSLTRPLSRQLFLAGLAGMLALLVPYNLALYALWPTDFAQDLRPFSDLARSSGAWLAGIVVSIGAPLSEELLFRGFLLPALALAGLETFVAIALTLLVLQMLAPVILPLFVPLVVTWFPLGKLVFGLNLALLLVAGMAWVARPSPARVASDVAPVTAADTEQDRGHAAGRAVDPVAFLLAAMFSTAAWTLMHMGYSLTGMLEVFMIGLYFCWLMWRTGNLWLTIALHGFYNAIQFLVLAVVPLPAAPAAAAMLVPGGA